MKLKELNNIDIVWSSEYVRCMSIAKYIAYKNNWLVNVDERLGERIHGDLTNVYIEENKLKQLKDTN